MIMIGTPATVMVITAVAMEVTVILKVMMPVVVIGVVALIMRLSGSHRAQYINGR